MYPVGFTTRIGMTNTQSFLEVLLLTGEISPNYDFIFCHSFFTGLRYGPWLLKPLYKWLMWAFDIVCVTYYTLYIITVEYEIYLKSKLCFCFWFGFISYVSLFTLLFNWNNGSRRMLEMKVVQSARLLNDSFYFFFLQK